MALPPAARTPQPTPVSTPPPLPPPGSRAHSHCSDQEGGGTRWGARAERGLGPGGRPGASAPTLPRTHGSPSSTGGSVSPVVAPGPRPSGKEEAGAWAEAGCCEVLSPRSRAHMLQQMKPMQLEPVLCSRRSHCNEKPKHYNKE